MVFSFCVTRINPCTHSKPSQENNSTFPQCFKMAEVSSAKILWVSFLPLGGSQFSKLCLSQNEGVGQAGSRGWWKGSTIRLGLCWSKQTVVVFWHVAPHSHPPCSPKQRQTVLKPLWLQFLRQELKAPAVSLQCSDFCSTLPCLPLGCLVMSAAFLAMDLSVYMQSFICLCAFMKRQQRNQHWHTWLMLALEKSCLHFIPCAFRFAAKIALDAEMSMEQFASRSLV